MIAENLKKARKAAGMSQIELAKRLNVYQKDISRWETGARTPTIELLSKICRELEVSADTILEIK